MERLSQLADIINAALAQEQAVSSDDYSEDSASESSQDVGSPPPIGAASCRPCRSCLGCRVHNTRVGVHQKLPGQQTFASLQICPTITEMPPMRARTSLRSQSCTS